MSARLVSAHPVSLRLSRADRERIEDAICWRSPAFFPTPGRSAWMRLQDPFEVEQGGATFTVRSVKLKGIGLMDYEDRFNRPSGAAFTRPFNHLAFAPDGAMMHLCSSAAPVGGMTLDRGFVEFFTAAALAEQGCPVQVPLSVYLYDQPEMVFQGKTGPALPLCVTVAGLSSEHWLRAGAINLLVPRPGEPEVVCDDIRVADVLAEWAVALGVGDTGERVLALFTGLLHQYGRTLRAFHESGFYRHNGGLGNLIYCPRRGAVVLTDLDSCRPLSECPERTRGLQQARDVASPLMWATVRLIGQRFIGLATPSQVFGARAHNPYLALLRGYYGDVDDAALERVSGVIEADYARRYTSARARHERFQAGEGDARSEGSGAPMSFQELRRQKEKMYFVDEETLQPFYTLAVADLHDRSGIGRAHPTQPCRAAALASLPDLLGAEEAAYICSQTDGLRVAATQSQADAVMGRSQDRCHVSFSQPERDVMEPEPRAAPAVSASARPAPPRPVGAERLPWLRRQLSAKIERDRARLRVRLVRDIELGPVHALAAYRSLMDRGWLGAVPGSARRPSLLDFANDSRRTLFLEHDGCPVAMSSCPLTATPDGVEGYIRATIGLRAGDPLMRFDARRGEMRPTGAVYGGGGGALPFYQAILDELDHTDGRMRPDWIIGFPRAASLPGLEGAEHAIQAVTENTALEPFLLACATSVYGDGGARQFVVGTTLVTGRERIDLDAPLYLPPDAELLAAIARATFYRAFGAAPPVQSEAGDAHRRAAPPPELLVEPVSSTACRIWVSGVEVLPRLRDALAAAIGGAPRQVALIAVQNHPCNLPLMEALGHWRCVPVGVTPRWSGRPHRIVWGAVHPDERRTIPALSLGATLSASPLGPLAHAVAERWHQHALRLEAPR